MNSPRVRAESVRSGLPEVGSAGASSPSLKLDRSNDAFGPGAGASGAGYVESEPGLAGDMDEEPHAVRVRRTLIVDVDPESLCFAAIDR